MAWSWHVYDIPPVDFRWEHLQTVDEVRRQLAERRSAGSETTFDLAGFDSAWADAQAAAQDAGWEGDHRNAPVVFWVPAEQEFEFGFVLKQDNNGTTFVVSPVELPHLAED